MGQAGRPREVPAGDEGGRSPRAQFDRANDEFRRIQSAEVAARTEVSRSRETDEETAGVAAHSAPASRPARLARARKEPRWRLKFVARKGNPGIPRRHWRQQAIGMEVWSASRRDKLSWVVEQVALE